MFGFATTSGTDTLLLSLVAPESGWHSFPPSLDLPCMYTRLVCIWDLGLFGEWRFAVKSQVHCVTLLWLLTFRRLKWNWLWLCSCDAEVWPICRALIQLVLVSLNKRKNWKVFGWSEKKKSIGKWKCKNHTLFICKLSKASKDQCLFFWKGGIKQARSSRKGPFDCFSNLKKTSWMNNFLVAKLR